MWGVILSHGEALVNWEEYRSFFNWDGSWLDLYIIRTTKDDWQRLLDFLRSRDFPFQFSLDEECPLPQEAAEIFATWEHAVPLLRIQTDGPVLNCHFFTEEEIEFDLDPREVPTEREAEKLFQFIQALGKALGKAVRMTPENLQEKVLLEYDPEMDVWLIGT